MKNLILTLTLLMSLSFLGCVDTAKDFLNPKPEAPWNDSYQDNSDNYNLLDGRLAGDIPDYTKTDGTSDMCWAVAVCNSLEYSGHVADNSDCVNTMKGQYGNQPGYAMNSYNWYMTDVLVLDPRDYYTAMYNHKEHVNFIADEIDDGNIVIWSLSPLTGNTGHVVAVYGWNLTDTGYIFYVVDGDDSKHTGIIEVTFDGEEWGIHSSGMYNKYSPNYAFSIGKGK